MQVRYATEHRCGVVIHGTGLSDDVTDTDPLKDNLPLRQSAAAADTPEVRDALAATAVAGQVGDAIVRVCTALTVPA